MSNDPGCVVTVMGDESVVDVAAVSPFEVAATSRPNQEDVVTDVPAASVHQRKHNRRQEDGRRRRQDKNEVGVGNAICRRQSGTYNGHTLQRLWRGASVRFLLPVACNTDAVFLRVLDEPQQFADTRNRVLPKVKITQ